MGDSSINRLDRVLVYFVHLEMEKQDLQQMDQTGHQVMDLQVTSESIVDIICLKHVVINHATGMHSQFKTSLTEQIDIFRLKSSYAIFL